MRTIRIALLVIASQLSLATMMIAQDAIETDRPDQTETATTVPAGHVQIEAGFVYENDVVTPFPDFGYPYSVERTTIAMPTVLVRVGLVEGFELRLESGIESVHDVVTTDAPDIDTTITDAVWPSIGIKSELMQEDGFIPQTAFIADITIPFEKESGRTAYVAPAFRFSMSHTLSDAFSLGYNFGAEWDGHTARGTGIYTLTVAVAVAETIGSYLEVFGEFAEGTTPLHSLDGGVTWQPQPNLQFDISSGVGLNDEAPDYYLSTGISIRLPD
ncbi:MAG: transporter [bacterium]|nr:transporter [Candidatus Kapabacteria bacterium]